MIDRRRGFQFGLAASSAAWLLAPAVALAQPQQAWELDGFVHPESAIFDAERGVIYVSNVAGNPNDKDGQGHISKVSPQGEMVAVEWVTGLDAPKGMGLDGDRLYVADVDQLVTVDVAAGEIVERRPAEGAQFLNDVTVDAEGRVYVSDMLENAIWRLDGDTFEVWVQDPNLASPNGLLAEEERIVVGAWGVMTDGFATKTPGHLKVIDLESQAISSLGDGAPVGNLDGVERDAEGNYLVTDWMAGALLRITPQGEVEQLLDLNQGSADLGLVPDQNLALIPMMSDGKLAAYNLQ